MTAKITASADGTKVNVGTAAEDALQIDATAKTIKGINNYEITTNGPAFRAANSNTSFPHNVATQFAGFASQFPASVAGWDPITGEYTIQKAGWYSMSFWMSVGQFAALSCNPYFQRYSFIPGNWSTFSGSFCSAGATAKDYISVVISGLQYFEIGDKLRVMGIVEWGDSGNHPLTDGSSQLNMAYLHP